MSPFSFMPPFFFKRSVMLSMISCCSLVSPTGRNRYQRAKSSTLAFCTCSIVGAQPKFRSLIAEWGGEAIGYALFFGFYSSLKGSGIFLEDLFVREAFRGRGIGRALLSEVARIARQEGSFGIRWEVLSWNESAIKFYKSLGGEFFDEWRQVLLQSDALNRLADG